MANLKEIRSKLRSSLNEELTETDAFSDSEQILSAFDRAWADTVTDLIDRLAPEPPRSASTCAKRKSRFRQQSKPARKNKPLLDKVTNQGHKE